MADRPKFFDDLAGVAGGAMSALAGVRDEAEALMRARFDEAIRHFDLAKREDVDAAMDVAAAARAGQEEAEAKLAGALERLDALEARLDALEAKPQPLGGGGPGMIA
jgi:BMFP domain-containing protein YqiC